MFPLDDFLAHEISRRMAFIFTCVTTCMHYLFSQQQVRTRYIVTVAAALSSLAYISHGALSIQTATS